MDEPIVINTGPIVTLFRIEALDLIGRLPFDFLCPEEVRDELDEGEEAGHPRISPEWRDVQAVESRLERISLTTLGRGEAAVIQLALEQGIRRVCIDEWKGSRAALVSGLKVTGVLGLLGRAKQLGLIPAIRPYTNKATASGIRDHPDLLAKVLSAAGE